MSSMVRTQPLGRYEADVVIGFLLMNKAAFGNEAYGTQSSVGRPLRRRSPARKSIGAIPKTTVAARYSVP